MKFHAVQGIAGASLLCLGVGLRWPWAGLALFGLLTLLDAIFDRRRTP